jgi:hypothetical protein
LGKAWSRASAALVRTRCEDRWKRGGDCRRVARGSALRARGAVGVRTSAVQPRWSPVAYTNDAARGYRDPRRNWPRKRRCTVVERLESMGARRPGRALVRHPASASTAAGRRPSVCRGRLPPRTRAGTGLTGQRFGAASWPDRKRSVDTLSAAARVFANYDNFPREESVS